MMKFATLVVCLGTVATVFASAASKYNLTLNNQVVVSGQDVKPGEYQLKLEGDRAILEGSGKPVECAVKVQEGSEKFKQTTVRYNMVDGKYRISEIHLGRTNTVVLFNN